jgi:fatty acid desaturase
MVRGIDPETDWPKVFTSRWVYGFFWNLISRALIIGAVIDFFRTVKTLFGQVLGKKDCMMRERCTAEDTAAIRIESVAILLIHLLIAAVAIGFHRWEILIFVSTPWFIGAPIEALWHQTEHIGRPYDVNDQRLCTRSVRVSPFIKVIYWGLDDHVEHHLFPGVPSCNLPKLHRILDKDHYLPESKNMVGCWREMFAIGREKDSCPDHEYVSIWMPVE